MQEKHLFITIKNTFCFLAKMNRLKEKPVTFMGRKYYLQTVEGQCTKQNRTPIILPDKSPVLLVREVPTVTTPRELKSFFQSRQKSAGGKVEMVIQKHDKTWLIVFENAKG